MNVVRPVGLSNSNNYDGSHLYHYMRWKNEYLCARGAGASIPALVGGSGVGADLIAFRERGGTSTIATVDGLSIGEAA